MKFLGTVYHEKGTAYPEKRGFFKPGRQRIDYYLAGNMLEGREFHAGFPAPDAVWRCIGIPPEAMEEISLIIRWLNGLNPWVSEDDAYAIGYEDDLNTLLSAGAYIFVYAKIDIAEQDSSTRTVCLYPPAFPCPFPGGWESVYRDHEEQVIEIDGDVDVDFEVWGEALAS